MQAIWGLDHVIIGVRDLEGAREDYTRLGFTCAPKGDHQTRGTANYCIMFPETYLELLGITKPDLDSGSLPEMLATRGEGLQRVALGTPDADAAKADLESAGLHPTGPVDLARPLEGSGEMVRFRNLTIPKVETAGLGCFLCGVKSPELMRPPELMQHPNGAVAFAGVTAVTEDPAGAAEALTKVFGADSAQERAFGFHVDTGRGVVRLTDPARFAAAHPGALPPEVPLPALYALRIAVESLDRAVGVLQDNGVEMSAINNGVRVLPEHARGVLIEFVAA